MRCGRTHLEELHNSVFSGGHKNPPANAGDIRDVGSIPGLGRTHKGGRGNPLQYPCPENPMAGYSPYGCKELDTTEAA